MFDTYRISNHLVPNPVNSKLIRLKEISKNRKHKKIEYRKSRTNEKILKILIVFVASVCQIIFESVSKPFLAAW